MRYREIVDEKFFDQLVVRGFTVNVAQGEFRLWEAGPEARTSDGTIHRTPQVRNPEANFTLTEDDLKLNSPVGLGESITLRSYGKTVFEGSGLISIRGSSGSIKFDPTPA